MGLHKGYKWTKFRSQRLRCINFLTRLYTRLVSEAIFKNEIEEAENLKKCLDFLTRIDYNNKWIKDKCPVCGALKVIKSEPFSISFLDRTNEYYDNTKIIIHRCLKCGFTTVEEENESKS